MPHPPVARRRALFPALRTGVIQAALAYACWGLFPLYFHALRNVPPAEMLAHRVAWSLVFLAAVLTALGRWSWLLPALRERRVLRCFAASAALIAVNWFVYIWAVAHGRVVEASLGYFLNPLVNVLLGALVLHERLRRAQWASVALAALGVAWIAATAGALPWIALLLAGSFSCYGLLRKTAPLGALEGLAIETLLIAPFAIGLLAWLAAQDRSAFAPASDAMQWLIAASGPLTAIPLLLFAAGARRIPFSLLGLLQYIGPTLQLGVGVLLFGEPFGPGRALGFALIWLALALYSAEAWLHGTRR